MNASTFWIQSNDHGELYCLDSGGTVKGKILAHKPGLLMFEGTDGIVRRIFLGDKTNNISIGEYFVKHLDVMDG